MGGWDLRLVDQIVDVWGCHISEGRTIVWIEQRSGPRAGRRGAVLSRRRVAEAAPIVGKV